jgi:hypothetical protein
VLRRRPTLPTRWALLLALGGMLLLGQQLALLHPLAHAAGLAQAHADAHHDGHGSDDGTADCDLCLGCAALAHLAGAAEVAATIALPYGAGALVAPSPAVVGRTHATCRNRGPPVLT